MKISIPEMPEIDSDDEYEIEKPKKPKLQPASDDKPRSGLFARLPAPTHTIGTGKKANRMLVPHVFSKEKSADEPASKTNSISDLKRKSMQAASKLITSKKLIISSEKDEVSDGEDNVNFFSYVDKPSTPPATSGSVGNATEISLVPDVESPYSILPPPPPEDVTTESTIESQQMNLNQTPSIDENFFRLQGKKNRKEEIKFIDIRADDALVGNREILLKTISQEKSMNRSSHSKKKNVGGPTSVQKRKHQMSYLAHQAKARELELKNSWADNRATKRQTQSRYGF